jgi:hypothetical protein
VGPRLLRVAVTVGPAARRPGAGAGRAWIAHNVVDHQSVPNEQHEQRADGRADKAGTLVEPIPTDGLTDEGGEESAGDAEQRRQDEAARLVRPGREETRDDAGDEPDRNDPDDVSTPQSPTISMPASDVRRSMHPDSRHAALNARNAIRPNFGVCALFE